MKKLLFIVMFIAGNVYGQNFEAESKKLAGELKQSLMKNLLTKINKDGVEAAIPFCHENVKPIAKAAAKDYISKYEFGRSSHKIRNSANLPQDWMKPFIEKYVGSSFDKNKVATYSEYSQLENGKRIYVEPLFVQAQCLSCHGEAVASNIASKIIGLYPTDKAVGFKLNEFRGIIWVKEK